MSRSLTNRMWTLILLAMCLLFGAASGLVPAAHANDGISYSDGAEGLPPGFVPPPGATGDPDWPVSPGSPAPGAKLDRRGGRADLLDHRGARVNVSPAQAHDVWMNRFQIMVRVWLAYFQR